MGRPSRDGALYQITLPYACGGVVLKKNSKGLLWVEETAPVFRWMRGKMWVDVVVWLNRKRASFVEVPYVRSLAEGW